MLIEHSLCGIHITREPNEQARYYEDTIGGKIFIIRMQQHYRLNEKCARLAAQDPVINFIDKSVNDDARKRKELLSRRQSSLSLKGSSSLST